MPLQLLWLIGSRYTGERSILKAGIELLCDNDELGSLLL